jgi:phage gp36-like protein
MAYATIADMESARSAELIRKLSDKNKTGQRDDAVLHAALARASSLADAYIDKKYAVPLASPPDYLVEAVIDVAVYRLVPDAMIGTDEFRKRYDDAIKLFKEIGKGEVTLAGATPIDAGTADPATGATGSKGVMVIAPQRLFKRDTEIL